MIRIRYYGKTVEEASIVTGKVLTLKDLKLIIDRIGENINDDIKLLIRDSDNGRYIDVKRIIINDESVILYDR